MVKKHTLSKYLLCGAAASALALVTPQAKAEDAMPAATTAAAPTSVSGTIEKYLVDRSGYVTAVSLKDSSGASQTVRFPANRASWIYMNYPTGGSADFWVVPGKHKDMWTAVGAGKETPAVWWRVIDTTDSDWLSAEPYIENGAREVMVSGSLRGLVYNNAGEVVALKLHTGDGGKVLVRVPPQVRQIAPGYDGSRGIAPTFRGANVVVVGTPEAPRKGGLPGFNQYIAGNSITINGMSVGAIGFQGKKAKHHMKYSDYEPVTTSVASAPAATRTAAVPTTSVTRTTTEQVTGMVKVVSTDGSVLPVVRRDGKMWIQNADASLAQLKQTNGKYVVPVEMTGARMMMVLPDGRRMDMDTVNGHLVVVLADGSMAAVRLHTL